MDYPKSVPGVGLVNGKFVDEDITTGTQGSLIPAAWGNAVTSELLAVIEASGQRPSEVDLSQLVQAIRSISASQAGHGQCRLSVTNAATLLLLPYGGNNLIIDGVPRQIPSAGISLSNAGLSAHADYYVYVYMGAAGMELECSRTAYGTDTNGVRIKLGNSAYTLVGWTRTNVSSQFAMDTPAMISTMNWFNRRPRNIVVSSTADLIFTNTSMSELSRTLQAVAPAWAGESCYSSINGIFLSSVGGAGVSVQLYSGGLAQGTRMSSNLDSDVHCPFSTQAIITGLSDGPLNCQLYGFVGSGAGRVAVGVQLLLTSWI